VHEQQGVESLLCLSVRLFVDTKMSSLGELATLAAFSCCKEVTNEKKYNLLMKVKQTVGFLLSVH